MNHHQTNDYVVDLDKIYEQLGFSRKDHCKRVIEKNFTEGNDYKITVPQIGDGRFASEKIMLNIDTFKNLCMLARTEEAKQIRKYYIKLENINNKIIKNSIKNNQILFNKDQINNSNRLIEHFGNKKDVIYMFSFKHSEEWYAKFGIVGELREFHNRVKEHQKEFGDVCFHLVMHCSNIYKIENDFKETALHMINKTKIPKKNGGFHVEILKLSEIVTTEKIKKEIIKIAGDRILDPLPDYTENKTSLLDLEKEKTKQMQIDLEIKQLSHQLEMRKLELSHQLELEKIRKKSLNKPTKKPEENIELVKKFMNLKTEFSREKSDYVFIEDLFNLFESWFQEINPRTTCIGQITFSKIIANIQDYTVVRIATGPRVGSSLPRKVGILNRKLI